MAIKQVNLFQLSGYLYSINLIGVLLVGVIF